MEKVCSVNLLQDMVNVPNVDAWLKQAAIEQKVGVSTFTKCVYFKKYLYNENTGPGLIIFVNLKVFVRGLIPNNRPVPVR